MSFKQMFSKDFPTSQTLTHAFQQYKLIIDEKIKEFLPTIGDKSTLREAVEYSLLNGGKRLRPALVFIVAKAVGFDSDVSFAALAIEFFHTASLVADDLPCMDNEDFRRNKPTVHKVYGEATAVLVTYTLISAAYECLAKCGDEFARSNAPHALSHDKITLLSLTNATRNTGLFGATGGQFLDLNPPNLSIDTLREVIQKKTVSLFEISFMIGWLFGGGDLKQTDLIKKAAYHFGMAFQIADDLGDMAQDRENECKVNFASALGMEKAIKVFHDEIEQFQKTARNLKIDSPELMEIAVYLNDQVSKMKLVSQ